MARFCDYRALIEEEVILEEKEEEGGGRCRREVGNELVDIVAEEGKGCCGRSKVGGERGGEKGEAKEEDK